MPESPEKSEKLAQCVFDIVVTNKRPPDDFGKLITELKATSEDLAGALTRVARNWGGGYFPHMQAIIKAHMDAALTREHVRAQEKMSASAGLLAAAGVFLAIVTLVASCQGLVR